MMTNTHVQHEHEGFPWKHVIGYILSIVLTAVAFWFVLSVHMSKSATIVSILILAVFQVLVQLLMFMHFTESDGGRAWQVTAVIFGFFIAFCVVGGSIWVMAFKSIVS